MCSHRLNCIIGKFDCRSIRKSAISKHLRQFQWCVSDGILNLKSMSEIIGKMHDMRNMHLWYKLDAVFIRLWNNGSTIGIR